MLSSLCKKAIRHASETFDPGILVLLPSGVGFTLNRFGLTKLNAILPFLEACFNPHAKELCALANKRLLEPLIEGRPIPFLALCNPGNRKGLGTFLDSLQVVEEAEETEEETESMDLSP
ncbi:hypothetical protein B7463_g3588, partial [Scytalidium lignicola]